MATRFVDKVATVTTTNTHNLPDAAGIAYDTADGVLKYNDAGTVRAVGSLGALATEALTAAETLTAADSGKTFFLNSATEFGVTLPLPAAGLQFRFIVTDAPETASYTIVTNGAAQILAGKVFGADGGAGDVENTPTATTITFVDGASVVGDQCEITSDGTSWFALCYTSVATTGITITG